MQPTTDPANAIIAIREVLPYSRNTVINNVTGSNNVAFWIVDFLFEIISSQHTNNK